MLMLWSFVVSGVAGSHFSVSRHPWINWFSCVVGAMGITNPCYWLLLVSREHGTFLWNENDDWRL
jgi:hypothetical protein